MAEEINHPSYSVMVSKTIVELKSRQCKKEYIEKYILNNYHVDENEFYQKLSDELQDGLTKGRYHNNNGYWFITPTERKRVHIAWAGTVYPFETTLTKSLVDSWFVPPSKGGLKLSEIKGNAVRYGIDIKGLRKEDLLHEFLALCQY